MLSLFPELLFLAPLAAFVIRIASGLVIARIAYRHVFMPATAMRILGIIEGIVAILLIAGAYTQAAALVAAIVIVLALILPAYRTLPRSTLALLLVMALSLLVTGAGPFAFDLPL
ncbi:MAG: hypothetical protein A2854_03045 [Parcubacteria group bacterium RIFCSPHIGHO2_01_FULL_56_18]|nr:MAG: hypothetical protein A2854_03045 [Parcubacteria group bacterium RIFCSPHIGHO2_01_FULL_56_18]